ESLVAKPVARVKKCRACFVTARRFAETFPLAEETLDQATCLREFRVVRFAGKAFTVTVSPRGAQIHVPDGWEELAREAFLRSHLIRQGVSYFPARLAASSASCFT